MTTTAATRRRRKRRRRNRSICTFLSTALEHLQIQHFLVKKDTQHYPILPIELGELRREIDSYLFQRRLVPSPLACAASAAKQAPPPAVAALGQLGVAQPEPALCRAEVPGPLGGAVGPGEASHDRGERGADHEAVAAKLRAAATFFFSFFVFVFFLILSRREERERVSFFFHSSFTLILRLLLRVFLSFKNVKKQAQNHNAP